MLRYAKIFLQVFYKVCYEEARPPLPEHMPESYASLMQACWHEDPLQRPSATYDPLNLAHVSALCD